MNSIPARLRGIENSGARFRRLLGASTPIAAKAALHRLKDGDRFDLTLNFEHASSECAKVRVQTPREMAGAHHPNLH